MVIKKIVTYGMLFLLALMLISCPANRYSDSCTNQHIVVLNQPNLIKIYPLQETYQIGDVLTYEAVIDSESDFFDEPVDIYDYSRATEVLLGGANIYTLLDNNYTLLEGDLRMLAGSEVSYLTYYADTNTYRFKFQVEFTQTGSYALPNNFRLVFEGDDYCRLVIIDRTDILGIPEDEGWFNFVVEN